MGSKSVWKGRKMSALWCVNPHLFPSLPFERPSRRKLWEWAAGERIWEDEGNYWACRPSSRQYRAFMGGGGAADGEGAADDGGGGRDGASLSLSAGLEEGDEEEEDGDELATETEESELEIDDAEMEELEEERAAALEEEGAAGTEGSVRSKHEAKEGEEKAVTAATTTAATGGSGAAPVHVLLLTTPNGGGGHDHERAPL